MLPYVMQNSTVIETSIMSSIKSTTLLEDVQATQLEALFRNQKFGLEKVQQLLREYLGDVVLHDFNLQLLAVTTSQEAYDIFKETISYFENLLIITDALTQIKKPSQGEFMHSFDDAAFVQDIRMQDYEQVIKRIKKVRACQKYMLKNNPKLETFIELLEAVRNQQTFTLCLPEKGTLYCDISLKSCTICFEFITPKFDAKQLFQKFVRTVAHMTSYNEADTEYAVQLGYFAEHARPEDSTDESALVQTPSQIIAKLAQVRGLLSAPEKDPICPALVMAKVVGHEFLGSRCVVTPDQLVCMFAVQKCLVLPKMITPFYLNKCLMYQATFDLGEYRPLGQLKDIPCTFMSQLAHQLSAVADNNFKATTLRQLVFPQWSLANVFIRVIERPVEDSSNSEEEQVQEDVDFKLIGIPTALQEPCNERKFIFSNLYLEYGFQYLVADLTSQVICVNDKLQTHLEHHCRLAHAFGLDLTNVMYAVSLLSPASFIQHILIHAQHATNFMFVSVTKHNVMSEQILAVFTILKSGFLRLVHPSFVRFIHFQLNYYEFVHYDR